MRQINWWRIMAGLFFGIAPVTCWTKLCLARAIHARSDTLAECLLESLIGALCYTSFLYFGYNRKNQSTVFTNQQDLDRWTSSFVFRNRTIFWFTIASGVSFSTIILQMISKQPTWLDVGIYSVAVPSAWLIAGQLLKPLRSSSKAMLPLFASSANGRIAPVSPAANTMPTREGVSVQNIVTPLPADQVAEIEVPRQIVRG